MDETKNEGYSDRIFNSIDAKFGLERSPNVETIYQYPKSGDSSLWLDQWTKEKDFKPWYYNINPFENSSNVRTIPAAKIVHVIHFLPPEAEEALKRQKTEETSWLDDELLNSQKPSMVKKYVAAFVDLLNNIKDKKLQGVDYIIGETNYRMANMALAFGFRRCWEEGYTPPDLSRSIVDESMSHKIGISVADLIDYYDLKNQIPTEKLVIQKMKEYNIGRHNFD